MGKYNTVKQVSLFIAQVFDDIELDEDYYQSLGISEEELADRASQA